MKISQLKIINKESFYNFVKKYWVKKVNLLFLKKVFEWQYISNKKYNFVIASDKKEIIGVQGFIPMSHYDNKLSHRDIFQAFLRVKEGKYIGTAVLLHKKIVTLYKANFVGVIGIDEITHSFHKWLGFKIYKMEHHFMLSKKHKNFKIALVKKNLTKKKFKNNLNVTYEELNLKNIKYKINNKLFDKVYPQKSRNYLINRYLKNPFYKYHLFQVKKFNKAIFIIVIRPIMLKNRNIIRLVDYIGTEKNFKFTKSVCEDLLNKFNAEYIDIYSHGISKKVFKESGFLNRYKFRNNEIIIPNYFEPFEKKNIDIYCAYKSKIKNKLKLFKGDGDGDRPNVAIN